MKRFAVLALALTMAFSLVCASADSWKGDMQVTVKSALEKKLDDRGEAVSDALESASMYFLISENAGVLSVNDAAFALDAGTVAGLNFCVGMGSWLDLVSGLQSELAGRTEGIDPREDIYSSLFTMSRYKELDPTETASLLENELLQWLFAAACEDLTALEAGMDAAHPSELSFFETEGCYLMKLDMVSGGNDILAIVSYDLSSVSAAVYIDSGVTDWDETCEAIREGETGRGVNAFLLTDIYGDETETYVEVSPNGLKTGKTWELTLTESGDDRTLDIMVKVDGKKYIDIEAALAVTDQALPEGASLDQAAELLGDDLGYAVTVMMGAVGNED